MAVAKQNTDKEMVHGREGSLELMDQDTKRFDWGKQKNAKND